MAEGPGGTQTGVQSVGGSQAALTDKTRARTGALPLSPLCLLSVYLFSDVLAVTYLSAGRRAFASRPRFTTSGLIGTY